MDDSIRSHWERLMANDEYLSQLIKRIGDDTQYTREEVANLRRENQDTMEHIRRDIADVRTAQSATDQRMAALESSTAARHTTNTNWLTHLPAFLAIIISACAAFKAFFTGAHH